MRVTPSWPILASTILLYGLGMPAASAQVITRGQGVGVVFGYSWFEDPAFATNGNGTLDPGESAIICMSISFSMQNQSVTFSPSAGGFSSGTILGLGYAFLDLTSTDPLAAGQYNNGESGPPGTMGGPNANAAGTSGYGVREDWRGQGNFNNGTISGSSGAGPFGVFGISPGQFATPSTANTENPVMCINRLGWTPASFPANPTTVNFTASAAAAAGNAPIALFLNLGGGRGVLAAVDPLDITYFGPGGIDIPIAPSPSGLALVFMTGLCGAGRRRRVHSGGAPR